MMNFISAAAEPDIGEIDFTRFYLAPGWMSPGIIGLQFYNKLVTFYLLSQTVFKL